MSDEHAPNRAEDAVIDKRNAEQWDAVEEATELLHEERFQEALIALRDVIKADPTNPYAFHYLGIGLFECGELQAARDAYRACLTLAPRHLGARVALCHVLRALGEGRDAIKEGMAALSQAPGDPDALHATGLAYLSRGDEGAAKKYLEAFLAAGAEVEVAAEVRAVLDAMNVGNVPRLN